MAGYAAGTGRTDHVPAFPPEAAPHSRLDRPDAGDLREAPLESYRRPTSWSSTPFHLFSGSAALLAASTVRWFQGKTRRDAKFYESSVSSDNFFDRADHHGASLMQQDAAVAPLLDQLE